MPVLSKPLASDQSSVYQQKKKLCDNCIIHLIKEAAIKGRDEFQLLLPKEKKALKDFVFCGGGAGTGIVAPNLRRVAGDRLRDRYPG